MEKEFVPYELTFKLKELGFDEPCFAGYNKNPVNDDDLGKLIYPTIKLDFEDEDIIFNDTESDEPNCWTIEHDVILAPTYSQAFRWFRDKYNLKSWIEEYTKNKYIYEIRPHKITDYKEGEIYVYATYEETELACLDKLIEIVES